MKTASGWLIAVIVVVLSGRSTVLVETAPEATDAKAKLFEPIPGKAVVYVFRGDALMGGDYTSTVLLDGEKIASGARKRYNVIVLAPGNHVLGVTSLFQAGYAMSAPIEVAEGNLYFAEVVWELAVGFTLVPAHPEKAKAAIRAGKLISWVEI